MVPGALVIMLFSAVQPQVAQSQTVAAFGRAVSPEEHIRHYMERAFRGITISPVVRDSARALVVASMVEQQTKIDFSAPNYQEVRQAIIDRRNARIRALLTSPDDRAKFDENLRTF